MVLAKDGLMNRKTEHEIIGKCFANAVREVVWTTTGIEVYEDKDNLEKNKKSNCYISGMMLLCGKKNAILSVTLSRVTASSLIGNMTGILNEEIKIDELCYGAAELANMIAGRAKADLVGTDYHFSITPPFSIVGEDYSLVHKSRMPKIFKKFGSEGIEMYLEVAYI